MRPLEEAFSASVQPTAVLLSSDVRPDDPPGILARNFDERGLPVFRVEDALLQLAADTETPQGILAICPWPSLSIKVPLGEPLLVLIADQIRDPGNLGTLVRSALGAGAHAVYVGPESVDPFSPKVIRAGMGSHFLIPVAFLDWTELPEVLQTCTIYAADSDADVQYDDVNWKLASAIIVGNETAGPSVNAIASAAARVGIPLANGLESLNAAIAGSVILFEAARQRRKGNDPDVAYIRAAQG